MAATPCDARGCMSAVATDTIPWMLGENGKRETCVIPALSNNKDGPRPEWLPPFFIACPSTPIHPSSPQIPVRVQRSCHQLHRIPHRGSTDATRLRQSPSPPSCNKLIIPFRLGRAKRPFTWNQQPRGLLDPRLSFTGPIGAIFFIRSKHSGYPRPISLPSAAVLPNGYRIVPHTLRWPPATPPAPSNC